MVSMAGSHMGEDEFEFLLDPHFEPPQPPPANANVS